MIDDCRILHLSHMRECSVFTQIESADPATGCEEIEKQYIKQFRTGGGSTGSVGGIDKLIYSNSWVT
jgi:hypothetical protein